MGLIKEIMDKRNSPFLSLIGSGIYLFAIFRQLESMGPPPGIEGVIFVTLLIVCVLLMAAYSLYRILVNMGYLNDYQKASGP